MESNPGVRVPEVWRALLIRALATSEVGRGSRDEGPDVVVSLPMDALRPAYGRLMGHIPEGARMTLTVKTLARPPERWEGNMGVTLISSFTSHSIRGHVPSQKDVSLWRKKGWLRPGERFSVEEQLPGAVEHELGHFIQFALGPATQFKFGRVSQAARTPSSRVGPTGDPSPDKSDWEYHAYLLSMGRLASDILRREDKSMDEAVAIAENYYPDHMASFAPNRLSAFRRDLRSVMRRMLEAPKDESPGWVKAQGEAKIAKRRRSKQQRKR